MDGKVATLAELGLTAQGGREARLTGLSVDSREVRPGHLFAALPGSVSPGAGFVALKGARTDGHDHVQDATQRGVSMVIVEQNVAVPNEIAVVQVPDSRQALAHLAATFHRHPAQSL